MSSFLPTLPMSKGQQNREKTWLSNTTSPGCSEGVLLVVPLRPRVQLASCLACLVVTDAEVYELFTVFTRCAPTAQCWGVCKDDAICHSKCCKSEASPSVGPLCLPLTEMVNRVWWWCCVARKQLHHWQQPCPAGQGNGLVRFHWCHRRREKDIFHQWLKSCALELSLPHHSVATDSEQWEPGNMLQWLQGCHW